MGKRIGWALVTLTAASALAWCVSGLWSALERPAPTPNPPARAPVAAALAPGREEISADGEREADTFSAPGREGEDRQAALGAGAPAEGEGRSLDLPAAGRTPRPRHIRGVYLSGFVSRSSEQVHKILNLVELTPLNAVVVEVKDDTGRLWLGPEMAELAAELNRRGIYSVARLAVFKDDALARRFPELAVRRADGRPWKEGGQWVSPYERRVWEYNVAVARQAAELGFAEIQFDYVRFPDVRGEVRLIYPGRDGRSRSQVIRDFLRYARAELQPEGVAVSADVFGLVTTAEGDLGIGQVLEELAPVVDYLCPMVYPSHYHPGCYGLPDPDRMPYETVYTSISGAVERLQAAGIEVNLVPWLQDFSLRHRYGKEEIWAQIRALSDAGIHDWLLWNVAGRYTWSALIGCEVAEERMIVPPPARTAASGGALAAPRRPPEERKVGGPAKEAGEQEAPPPAPAPEAAPAEAGAATAGEAGEAGEATAAEPAPAGSGPGLPPKESRGAPAAPLPAQTSPEAAETEEGVTSTQV
ncbi:MAG: putative glycoside hydrolase [Bacillota bacterium]|nr:putative glycoside hydrolase [Bacillota bacterium]